MHPIPTHAASHTPVRATAATSRGDGGCWQSWAGASLLLTCLAATDAWGFALGRAQVLSAIGEPLRVVVDLPALSQEEAETLQVVIAPPDAFQASQLEYKPLLSGLKLEIERGRDGVARLKLQGSRAVNEAYVELLLQASWKGGQFTRDYTLLLEPTGTAMPPEPPSSMTAATPAARRVAPAPPRPGTSAKPAERPEAQPRTARKPAPELAAAPAAALAVAPARVPTPEPATTPPPDAKAPVAAAPASPTGSTAAPTPAKAPAPAVTTPPAVPEGAWPTQPTLLAAAALLLAALAGWLVWQRQRQQAQDHADAARLGPAGLTVAAGAGPSADTSRSLSSMMDSPEQIEASGEIDPIAEADVYLAYGRVQQAEDILRDALLVHPDQASLRLKLLEIAVQRQDRAACMALLGQLSVLTREQGPDWQEASELASRLPPELPEPGTANLMDTPTAPVIEPATQTSASPAPAAMPQDLPIIDLSLSAPEPVEAPEAATVPLDNGLEFSLDLDQIGSASPQEPPAARVPESARSGLPELAFDFELKPENKADELTDLLVSEDNSVSDPLATQLELAREFLALGDADGARSLAERVLARATGDLQARARALLEQLEAARPQ
ncbi:FimV/HubP family polar landmark protein [Malikia sp.]|uniref:FimV/HubP family polar landmark protein n=1 Tax=Malikia sp. TaxID=2070706 RepID=UPI002630AB99|nr:FimV/HubP family polar landmark protein [Malikia sp.]MDD2727586.1 hypothetical protein [Malikia sp.]